MATILLAWELGANLGHIDRQLVIARALRDLGHLPVFVLRDLSRAQLRVAGEGFRMGQAPVWLPRMNQPPQLLNFANVLAAAGWLDAPGLAGLISGWRTWFDLLQPAAMLCDHAPTALLAARGLGITTWACGSGFELPPAPGGSFAPFMAGPGHDAAACRRWDDTVLQPVNAALALANGSGAAAPLARLSALFDGVHKALLTLPELAHYEGLAEHSVRWAGPVFAADSGVPAVWPDGIGRRAFVYLDPGSAMFEPVVLALKAAKLRAIVHAKGLAPQAAQRLGAPGLRFEAAPVRLDAAVAAADVVVCHGGQGTMAAALLAGKPLLLVPSQLEQAMVARRVAAQGLGLVVDAGSDGRHVAALLTQLLQTPAYTQAAQAVAARHVGHSAARTGEKLAQWVAASLDGPNG